MQRFWAYSSGDGLETLIATAGKELKGAVIPDELEEVDVDAVRQSLAARKVHFSA